MNSKYKFSQDAIDNFMFIHAYWKNSCDGINAAPENKWGYKRGDIPFIDYLCEDKYTPVPNLIHRYKNKAVILLISLYMIRIMIFLLVTLVVFL